jgi:hypothetical protein
MPGDVDVREDVLSGLELEPPAHDRGAWSALDVRLGAAAVLLFCVVELGGRVGTSGDRVPFEAAEDHNDIGIDVETAGISSGRPAIMPILFLSSVGGLRGRG